MRRSITMTIILGMLAVAACKKDEGKQEPVSAKPAEPGTAAKDTKDTKATDTAKPASGDPVASTGVSAGGIEHDAKEGPAGVVTAAKGTVEVRRLGETTFAAAKADTKLYPGDAIRTGESSTATVTLADESIIEVAEVSTIAVTSREGTADPASAAAVLGGLARFTVTARAPGEGAFRVYTPAGVVVTRGTVYGVGVAASGEVRVGVESGAVDVIGLTQIAETPVMIDGGAVVVLDASGTVGSPARWPADDWGTWRDDTDAKLEINASIDAHADAMAHLNQLLIESYADLDAAADSIATFEANASVAADKGDTATYEASLPEGAATIDASFSLAGRLELFTWAYASHATLATDLYVRHPAEVKWEVVAPRVDAAILWPKRYEVTASAYLEPLRMQYYVHHPRGRVNAHFVGVAVPEFYAKVDAPTIEPARVRGRVKSTIWLAPQVTYTASARPVWVSWPSANWRANVKVAPAPFRANGGWYVRPATLKGKALVGSNVSGKWDSRLTVAAPQPRANLHAAWKVPVGMKIKVGAPNLDAGAKARASWKLGAGGGVDVRDHRADVKGKMDVHAPDVRTEVKGKLDVKVPTVDVRGGANIGVRAGGKASADAKAAADASARAAADARAAAAAAANAKASIKIKAPEVKIKAPSLKVKGEAKGGFKIGN